MRYDPAVIEPKWQAEWSRQDLYRAPDDDLRPKYYRRARKAAVPLGHADERACVGLSQSLLRYAVL